MSAKGFIKNIRREGRCITMKAFRTYMDLIFKLISFKFKNPEYAKQIEKALPILVDEEVIAAIDADLNTLEEDDKPC